MMQNHNMGHVMDQELHSMRVQMQERIRNWLERRIISTPSDWQQRLPDLTRRVEATIYRAYPTKEEYAKNFETPIENHLARILRGLKQKQLQHMEFQQLLLRQQQLVQLQLQLQVRQQQLEQEQEQHQHDIASDSAATSIVITEPSMMESSSASVNNLGDLDLEDVTSGRVDKE